MPNKERLTLMRDMLVEVQTGTWTPSGPLAHLSFVTGPVDFDLHDWGRPSPEPQREACGFKACAIGHALLDERFQALGLKDHHQATLIRYIDQSNAEDEDAAHRLSLVPEYEDRYSFDGVNRFFGIDGQTGTNLFMGSQYRRSTDLGEVISRLNALIATL